MRIRGTPSRSSRTALALWTLAIAGLRAAGVAPVSAAPLQLKPEDAVALAYPGAQALPETLYLTDAQSREAARISGEEIPSRMIKRFVVRKDGKRIGTAYLDSHRVRSSGETLCVALDARGGIIRIEVISFFEPAEYQPRAQWLGQFNGKGPAHLENELQLKRGIHPITGATLTARAVTAASRRVLGIHRAVEAPAEARK